MRNEGRRRKTEDGGMTKQTYRLQIPRVHEDKNNKLKLIQDISKTERQKADSDNS